VNAVLPARVRAVYPWSGTTLRVSGGRMHLVDTGPRTGEVVLAVHGNPTWSFYWRKLITHLEPTHRVVVPDHIGCGLSDKPQHWSYRLRDHVDNLVEVIDRLDLHDITLVVHDWGGAIGMGAATLRPERIARLVITNTAAWRSPRIPPSIATVKVPVFGALAVRGFNGFAQAATVRATEKGLNPIAKAGLLFPYRSWHDRIATLRFVQDIPMHAGHPSWAELARIEQNIPVIADRPAMIAWGDADWCFTPAFREEWMTRLPDARVHAWPDVGHYVMEDAPERFLTALDAFLQETSA